MARKIVEPEMEPMPPEPDNEDVVVLKKSWVVTFGVGLASFLCGGIFFTFLAFNIRGGFLANSGIGGVAQQQPQIIQQQAPAQPTDVPHLDNVAVGILPVLGPENAKVTIVEFSDFQCPFCKSFRDNTFDAIRQKYGDKIKIYYRNFPLVSIHPQAMKGAMAAMCANEQGKFWEMHDQLFATQDVISPENSKALAAKLGLDTEKFNSCLDGDKYTDAINKDVQDGSAYGVSGTPTFFINGWRVVGAQPLTAFTTLIDQQLNQ